MDYDFHSGSFSASVLDIQIEKDIYLYNFLIIEPATAGITRLMNKKDIFIYDKLSGIERVQRIYNFIFAMRVPMGNQINLKVIFHDIIEYLNFGYAWEHRIYGCRLRPDWD